MTNDANKPQNQALNYLQKLALAQIRAYEDELEAYGLHVRCGMELEFHVTDKDGVPTGGTLNLEQALKYLHDDAGLPQVERLYDERTAQNTRDPNIPSFKHEVTVGRTEGAPNITTAEVAGTIKTLKASALAEMLKCSSCLSTPENYAHSGLKPNFSAYPSYTDPNFVDHTLETAGLHVNISLQNAEGRNVFASCPPLMLQCARELVKLQEQTMLAYIPHGQESLARIHNGASSPKGLGAIWKVPVELPGAKYNSVHYRYNGDLKEQKDAVFPSVKHAKALGEEESLRIENRLSGADVDPYVAAALTLAAMVSAVRKNVINPNRADAFLIDSTCHYAAVEGLDGLYIKLPDGDRVISMIPQKVHEIQAKFLEERELQNLLGRDLHTAIFEAYPLPGEVKAIRR